MTPLRAIYSFFFAFFLVWNAFYGTAWLSYYHLRVNELLSPLLVMLNSEPPTPLRAKSQFPLTETFPEGGGIDHSDRI